MPDFRGPNAVIGSGIAILWSGVALFVWYLFAGSLFWGHAYPVLVIVFVAYVLSFIACGVGVLWADRVARSADLTRPRSTRALVQAGFGSLLLPWVVLPIALWLTGTK